MNRDNGKACASTPAELSGGAGEVSWYVQVMTDEQVEVLGKQISIYAIICEQLLEMYRGLAAHQGSIAGAKPTNLYCDPPMVHGDRKFTARQRWAPTRMQLQILETIFGQGNGALPGRQKIQDITAELSQHGRVAETNVYNWFQNRRARAKRNLKPSRKHRRQINNAGSEAQARSSSN